MSDVAAVEIQSAPETTQGKMSSHLTSELRLCVPIIIAGLVVGVLLVFGFAPQKEFLTQVPNDQTKPAIAFEATYYGYLSGVTIPMMAGLLVFLVQNHDTGKWRASTLIAMFAFSFAMILITIAYAMRVQWMNQNAGFPTWVVFLDKQVSGPVSALCYVIGIFEILRIALFGPPPKERDVDLKRLIDDLVSQKRVETNPDGPCAV